MAHSDHGDYREEFSGEHAHSYDHHEPKYPIIWMILGGTVLFLAISGIVIQTYVEGLWSNQTYDKVLSQDNWTLRDLHKKEHEELTKFGVADAKAAVMRMPIEQAMKSVVAESASPKYPVAPYKVKTPEELAASPAVSPQGAAAAQNTQNQGVVSNPHVQQSTVPQQPNR